MNNSELKLRLIKLRKGLEPLSNPESKIRKLIEEANGFDLLVSMDIFNLELIYDFLVKQERNEYKSILNVRITLEDFSTQQKIKSIWKDATKVFRKNRIIQELSLKEHFKYFISDIKSSLPRKSKWALGFIFYVYILLLGTFIFSFFGKEIVLSSIGVLISLVFITLHFRFLYKHIIWRELE